MKSLIVSWLCVPTFSVGLAADDSSWEFQGGYGMLRADGQDVGKPYQLYGWDVALTLFFKPKVGLTARVSSGYGDVPYRAEIIDTSAYRSAQPSSSDDRNLNRSRTRSSPPI